MSHPAALYRLVVPAGVILIIAALAHALDPHYAATPFIADVARGYYLASFVILGLVIAGEVVRRTLAAPEIPTAIAGWALVVGAATLVFAGHRSVAFIVIVLALAAAEAATRETQPDAPQSYRALIGQAATFALLWLLLFGLVEYHLRWLYAFPIAGSAGALAYLRHAGTARPLTRGDLLTAAVLGLAAIQMVAAVSFLNVSAATAATLIALALAGVYLAGQVEWRRGAR